MGAQWKAKGRAAAADAKGRVFTKLSKEVAVAARAGADPDMNPRLRMAIAAAKKASMPRDTLERAIKKGAGLLENNVQYETVVYEGFAPHQVPVMVECLTENKNRTATNIRILFRGGQLAGSGAVSWDFNHVGLIEATGPEGVDAEEAAIEAGAQDVSVDDQGDAQFVTDPGDLDSVSKALGQSGWNVSAASLGWVSKNPVSLDGEKRSEVEAFLQTIDEDDDVQTMYVGLK